MLENWDLGKKIEDCDSLIFGLSNSKQKDIIDISYC